MRVKVCGITRYEDARLALDWGAWAVGLIFHPPSPRAISPDRAEALVRRLPPGTLAVGVFVDAPAETIRETVERVGLRGVQLHGKEPPEAAAAAGTQVVIKAFRAVPGFDLREMDRYPGCLVLLDSGRPGLPGGTGETCDWSLAREAQRKRPILLAGGLRPGNVREAVESVRPEGIDVATGVEAAPGLKDPVKLRELFEEVARAGTTGPPDPS